MRALVGRRRAVAVLGLIAGLWGCGGGDGTGPDGGGDKPGDGVPAAMAAHSPADQSAPKGAQVGAAPAVVVTDKAGKPVKNVAVTFAVTSGGGALGTTSATTDAQGVASAQSWTLGPAAGANTVTAKIGGGAIAPVTFRATATDGLPKWTVMVFMAADNNLAVQGILDIDEMESAVADPNVQVVVQAEFNKETLKQYGCGASCFNRPNFNTFRYLVTHGGKEVNGPNGPAEDIGNRNMTDPAQLREFIQWAKQKYPAEHYAVVLWNHGGGYVGLLQDQTSAGSGLMSLAGLSQALDGVGKIDLLDFDMCLMAGYETLAMLRGKVDYAVFSEETMPGEGNPYKRILDAMHANPSADGRATAIAWADQIHASYQNDRASTTISAYDLAQFGAFETALDALAGTLRTNLGALRPTILGAVKASQKYAYPELTDIGSLLDELKKGTTDATLNQQIAALQAQATGGFRLASHARTGSARDAGDVTRSTGLNIVLPSGEGDDKLGDNGPRSFTAYQGMLGGKAWTGFLNDWLNGQSTTGMYDQGATTRFESYLVWAENAPAAGADVDFWILEPNGNLYIPFLGSVTPNGTLTNDSYTDGTYFEGYLTNRYVEAGAYKLYASLYRAPSKTYAVPYELAFRFDQSKDFAALFDGDYPTLTLETSWLDDADPTFEEIEAGAYTDLQYVARATIGVAANDYRAMTAAVRGARGTVSASMSAMSAPGAGNRITPAQLRTARELRAQRGGRTVPSWQSRRLTERMTRLLPRIGPRNGRSAR